MDEIENGAVPGDRRGGGWKNKGRGGKRKYFSCGVGAPAVEKEKRKRGKGRERVFFKVHLENRSVHLGLYCSARGNR